MYVHAVIFSVECVWIKFISTIEELNYSIKANIHYWKKTTATFIWATSFLLHIAYTDTFNREHFVATGRLKSHSSKGKCECWDWMKNMKWKSASQLCVSHGFWWSHCSQMAVAVTFYWLQQQTFKISFPTQTCYGKT